jgi:hypothetical protein
MAYLFILYKWSVWDSNHPTLQPLISPGLYCIFYVWNISYHPFITLIISVLAVLATYHCIRFDIKADYPHTLIATAIIFLQGTI